MFAPAAGVDWLPMVTAN